MLRYTVHRLVVMVPTLLAVSMLVFVIIQLPPGDYFTTYINELQSQGETVSAERIEFLKQQYGFDKHPVEQYFVWMFGLLQGDFGYSFEHSLPVSDIIGDRILLTFIVSFSTIVFTWVVSFIIGAYSACTNTAWATTPSPFWASSGWRRRTSCWRWSCCGWPTYISAPRSAG